MTLTRPTVLETFSMMQREKRYNDETRAWMKKFMNSHPTKTVRLYMGDGILESVSRKYVFFKCKELGIFCFSKCGWEWIDDLLLRSDVKHVMDIYRPRTKSKFHAIDY